MRKLVVPNSFFADAAEALKNGQSVRLHVDGQSMYPFIHGGKDEILVAPYDGKSPLEPWCCPFYQWGGNYMIHRLIGSDGDICRMLGDGNLYRIEEVPRHEIIGILRIIYHPDGSEQDCMDSRWLKKAQWWYRLRKVRRFLIPLFRMLGI
ncbi:MAG: S24/S26 family peptidase [Bacteroidaceae bacterium]|nr:S24/S26 family peptidase [Bacteroidaceae bacterium]